MFLKIELRMYILGLRMKRVVNCIENKKLNFK